MGNIHDGEKNNSFADYMEIIIRPIKVSYIFM